MEYKLSDLFALQMGKTPARDEPRYWQNGTHPWISIADLSAADKFIESTKEAISDFAVEESNIYRIPRDTVVMSFKLSLGKVAITKRPMFSNEAIMAFAPRDGVDISADYLYYLLKARRWDDGGNKAVKGITLNKATLSGVKVHIHSADKQRQIVHILDKLWSVIKYRRTQLSKLDELVKCRFVEMFGNPANNSKNWVTKPLRDCLSSIDGGKSFVCQPSARTRDWPAILKLSAITSGFYQPNENKAVIDNEHFSTSAEVKAGDLLFTRKNTPELVGISAYVYHSPVKLMIPDLIFRLNTNENCNKIFLWKLINHELFRSSISASATGSAKSMSNISQERLLKLHIICPPVEQQNAFAFFVQRIDKLRFISGRKRVLRPSCTNELALTP